MMSSTISEGLSFDDVLLVPARSAVLPTEVELSTSAVQGIEVHIPVLSSAMDTVSEHDLAIALAREGGMGVIHRNCPIGEQADMVAKVKRSENIVIERPQCISPDATVGQLKELQDQTGLSGFPVVDGNQVLCGIVTRRDMWGLENDAQPVRDIMTPSDRLVTAPRGISQDDAKAVLYRNRIEKLPILDKDGTLFGLMTSADIEKRERYGQACKDDVGHLRVGAAIGAGEDAFERAQALDEAGADALFIDAATGHTERTLTLLEKLKTDLPGALVVAGNVVTEEGARDLIDAGASAIKVGVGPGSICTTRVVAGVGVPQFTAVQNAAGICLERGVPLIADGGIRYSGDIIKALAAGASAVMLGSLLAGTEESPGNTVRFQGRTFKEYRGMGSIGAMRKGSSDRYGQNASGKLVPEGVEGRVPFKGSLGNLIFQLMGGVRSGMGYVGAASLAELHEKARFVRITHGGLKESHPHDIMITEEPINYSSL